MFNEVKRGDAGGHLGSWSRLPPLTLDPVTMRRGEGERAPERRGPQEEAPLPARSSPAPPREEADNGGPPPPPLIGLPSVGIRGAKFRTGLPRGARGAAATTAAPAAGGGSCISSAQKDVDRPRLLERK